MAEIGLLTNCLQGSLEEKMKRVHALGYTTLELACWPKGHPKGCDIDAENYSTNDIKQIKNLLKRYKLSIISLAYYDNLLDANINERFHHQQHLRRLIGLAAKLGVPNVATYAGKDRQLSLKENFALLKHDFLPLAKLARRKGIRILIENCPMPSWSPEGWPSTLTYSPEMISKFFDVVGLDNVGLNLDVSHLYWQRIDYLSYLQANIDRIYSLHVKDVTLKDTELDRYGIYGKSVDKKHRFDYGYYQPTLPGYGDIDWPSVFRILKANGKNIPLQVEYKNSNGFGEIKNIDQGLEMARNYIAEVWRSCDE